MELEKIRAGSNWQGVSEVRKKELDIEALGKVCGRMLVFGKDRCKV